MLLPSDGVNFLIAINTGTAEAPIWTILGGQRGASLKMQADEIDASSKTSDGWKDTIPGLRSWGIEADALVLTDDDGTDTDEAYDKLEECYLNRQKVHVQYTKKNGSRWQGYCTITDLSEEAPHDDVVTYKLTLSGIGKPTKVQGVKQVETATVAGVAVTTAGNATVTVTKTGMAGSPKAVSVALALGDSLAVQAQKIREALAADATVGATGTFGGIGAKVVWEFATAAANDATANIAIAPGTSVGLTAMPASEDTRPGVAPPA